MSGHSALARTEAELAGFDEAIMLNEAGSVAEGAAMPVAEWLRREP